MYKIYFKREEGVALPEYQTAGASGFDVTAEKILKVFDGKKEVTGERLEKILTTFERTGEIKIRDHERILFGTGLYPELPKNLELQVRSRSGLSLKRGLIVANQPGTIDSDYRGEIGIILLNTNKYLGEVKKGERIAQLVASEVVRPMIQETAELSETERNSGGYGSTGTN